MQNLGLLICSFNPVLEEHLIAARSAVRELNLDRVLFLPFSGKAGSAASPGGECRLEMCRRALVNERRMETGFFFRSASELVSLCADRFGSCTDTRLFCLIEDRAYPALLGKKQGNAFFKEASVLLIGEDSAAKSGKAGQEKEEMPRFFSGVSLSRAEKECKRTLRNLACPENMNAGVLEYAAENGLYQPDHSREIRGMINEHRWIHTLGVRSTAVRLASRFGANVLKAAAAALYHDCAKDMNVKEMRRIMTQEYRCNDEDTLRSGALMHGPVGAVVARERFGMEDPEVLDAIRFHTTGREEMTLLDLVVFVADAIEPNREDYPGLSEIRRLAEQSLDLAALESLRRTMGFVAAQGKVFNPQGERTMRALERRTAAAARA